MKKIISLLMSLGLITTIGATTIACSKTVNNNDNNEDDDENLEQDEDYIIPNLEDQPLSLNDALTSYGSWYDKVENYKQELNQEWKEYVSTIANWDDLNQQEQLNLSNEFHHNSDTSQRLNISSFWVQTYQYKIAQFIENQTIIITTPNGIDTSIKINSYTEELYTYNYNYNYIQNEEGIYYDSFSKKTLIHIENIYEWGIQNNPNIIQLKMFR